MQNINITLTEKEIEAIFNSMFRFNSECKVSQKQLEENHDIMGKLIDAIQAQRK